MSVVYGTPVVPGHALAKVVWVQRASLPTDDGTSLPEDQREAAVQRFEKAAQTVAERLNERASTIIGTGSDVLRMTAVMATDPMWHDKVHNFIMTGTPAEVAVVAATDQIVQMLTQAGGIMAERVTDIKDVRDRVIAHLRGEPEPGVPDVDEEVVLFAQDLAPADTAGLDPKLIQAIVTVLGGPTSHTSIIARQLDIPCIVAARQLEEIPAGTLVLVDATSGEITPNPDPEVGRQTLENEKARHQKIAAWRGPAQLKDGTKVQLLANVQDGPGAQAAARGAAEGIGLLRTELSFLSSPTEPSVDQQARAYAQVFEAFPTAKVIVRTLDAGSDKPVAWVNMEHEENPALGVRGLRTSGNHPDLLLKQLDAIKQASQQVDPDGKAKHWVMAPMVSTLAEAKWFVDLVHERGMVGGIMVEVPAVAALAPRFMEVVDFVSIGTNDLTQYVMAADRMSPHLATYNDTWQPAVLAMIAQVAQAGQDSGTPVGVCGEAGADPTLAAVLVGLGVTSLSMAPPTIPVVGLALSEVTLQQCREAAAVALAATSPDEARRAVNKIINP